MSDPDRKRKTLPMGALKQFRAEHADARFPVSDSLKLILRGIDENSPADSQMEAEILVALDGLHQKVSHFIGLVEHNERNRPGFERIQHSFNQLELPKKVPFILFRLSWLTPISCVSFAGMVIIALIMFLIHAPKAS